MHNSEGKVSHDLHSCLLGYITIAVHMILVFLQVAFATPVHAVSRGVTQLLLNESEKVASLSLPFKPGLVLLY